MAQILKEDNAKDLTGSANGNTPTGWVGWVYFAGLMMMLAGAFQIIAGLVAIFKQSVFFVTPESVLVFNYAQWGWLHLLIGIVLFFSSFGVMRGSTWGRMLGSFLAGLSAVANFALVPVHPLWSIIVIVVDIFIIYALVAHGREAQINDRY